MRRFTLLFALLGLAQGAAAHHSTTAIYDSSRTIEVTGIVEEVSWRNPHGRLLVRAPDEEGGEVVWEAETAAVVILRILGIGQDFIDVGDRITIAGFPARREPHEMNARNILLASGYELAFGANVPYFPAGKNGNLIGRSYDDSNVDEAIANADGIFRVWATNMTDPAAFPLFKGGYPLTAAAEAVVAEWDPLDNDLLRCGMKGQPLIMITPAPVEFARDGDRILMRIEEYDSLRVIHMNEDAEPPDEQTQMGFSRGRFEGETLVVATDHIQAQYFDPDGVPQSEQLRTVERFTPNAAYDRLDYRITVTDPVYFTEPFDLTRYFVWKPEMTVVPYNCLERDWR
ncbi:DUF6152 family protein [Candidatus Rariloculus sp.]|uniref:DUF6152 family protein n=1 Tax=Candidatus Rariloculus sp. TaxID=3101265 RepID=UPI003D0AF83E